MNLPQTAWQISVLADSAKALAKQGNWKDAAEIYERVLAAAPYHVQALNFLAARAMESDDSGRSIALLERSIQAEPSRAKTHMNLGVVLFNLGNLDGADAALNHALQLNPSLAIAALYKGRILEARGNADEAIALYRRTWREQPQLEQQLFASATPTPRRALLQYVALLLRSQYREAFSATLRQIADEYPGQELGRLEQFAAICLGEMPLRYADAAQQPSYLFFPGLAPMPFYDAAQFEWLRPLENDMAHIRAELEAVLASPETLSPYVQIDSAPDAGRWNELNHSLHWGSYHLYKNGSKVAAHCERCPVTTAALEALPLVKVPDHAPEAFFSVLQPGTHIPPHFGLANYKLAVHLPLIIPPDCAIRVGHRTEIWTPGQCLVFDDSFRHEAWNRSDQLRAVLIFEIWNPELNAAEIAGIARLVTTLRKFDAA